MAQPTFPKVVTGYVWDSAGTPLEEADITVNLKNGPLIKYMQTDATDSSGEYSGPVAEVSSPEIPPHSQLKQVEQR